MADFGAKDVKRLRDQTGAGMMDAKKALVETDGDFEAAAKWLREKGLASAGQRAGRESSQGAVALARAGNVAALVQLRCETDFVAKSPDFVSLANDLAQLVADDGEAALDSRKDDVDSLKLTLKENISLGRVVRFEVAEGNLLDTYLHVQSGRGVNAVLVELQGGGQELAHDIAVHTAFAKPQYLTREEVPEETVAEEKATFEAQARNSGKPEAALDKIVEGMLTGWFKERVLLDQPFAKDDKQSVQQVLGEARVVRFAQVVIGG
ncbi:MAG TPA: translation elongation factor Ts [Acidimicrobiales bacterium]|nr:translation elongation factor Ts [Acidimicrobiales bacterium]